MYIHKIFLFISKIEIMETFDLHIFKDFIRNIYFNRNRITWDEYFASIVLLLSTRSPSKRLQVGSVIVKDNRIISSGYNGFLSGVPHESIIRDGHEINTIHAEQNTIADASKRGVCIADGTMYITHFPCIHCAKMIISSGIKKIIYIDDYHNDPLVEKLCIDSKVILQKYS